MTALMLSPPQLPQIKPKTINAVMSQNISRKKRLFWLKTMMETLQLTLHILYCFYSAPVHPLIILLAMFLYLSCTSLISEKISI